MPSGFREAFVAGVKRAEMLGNFVMFAVVQDNSQVNHGLVERKNQRSGRSSRIQKERI